MHGEGREPVAVGFDSNRGVIRLPNEVIIPGNTPTALIDFVYGDIENPEKLEKSVN